MMIKKLSILLLAVLLLCPGVSAWAEDGVEILVMDGVPVVVESVGLNAGETNAFRAGEGFALPASFISIEEEAFAGIAAARVEITENVLAIGARAFADCKNLRELVIPATVDSIDDSALAGSENVTVYGAEGSEAQRFAEANGIPFVPTETDPEELSAPVILPYIELF